MLPQPANKLYVESILCISKPKNSKFSSKLNPRESHHQHGTPTHTGLWVEGVECVERKLSNKALMNVDAIRAVLRRFKKDQFPVLLERWAFAEAFRDVDISGSKQHVVQTLVAACLVRQNLLFQTMMFRSCVFVC